MPVPVPALPLLAFLLQAVFISVSGVMAPGPLTAVLVLSWRFGMEGIEALVHDLG